MAKTKKKPKPFNIRKFVEAGWEFTESANKNRGGVHVTQYFKSPRLDRKYHIGNYDMDDPLFTEDYILNKEFEHFKDELYYKASNEMNRIIRENINHNYTRLTV